MWRSPEPRFDVASAICQGGRAYQEDAIVTDFPAGTDIGVTVLADGMGGHAAGDVASKIVLTEVYGELKFESANFSEFESEIPNYLTSAAVNANLCVKDYVGENPKARGMGATLVAVVMVENRMYWMSIGDSPLYHMRGGKLRQLNEDHSMAPQIDFMVKSGLMDPETAKNHPDRNCLTSVILGGKVAKSDCPKKPFELQVGDMVIVSSDGLQYLEEPRIEKILYKYRRRKSAEIAERLLQAIVDLSDPEQDNISFAVIKLNHDKPATRVMTRRPLDYIEETTKRTTRVVSIDGKDYVAENEPDSPSKPAEPAASAKAAAGKGKGKDKPLVLDDAVEEPAKKAAAGGD